MLSTDTQLQRTQIKAVAESGGYDDSAAEEGADGASSDSDPIDDTPQQQRRSAAAAGAAAASGAAATRGASDLGDLKLCGDWWLTAAERTQKAAAAAKAEREHTRNRMLYERNLSRRREFAASVEQLHQRTQAARRLLIISDKPAQADAQ